MVKINKNKGKPFDYRRKEIQVAGNLLLQRTINELNTLDLHWITRSEEDQNDKGTDFECELEEKISRKSIYQFKIQNKGVSDTLIPLKKTENRGFISFPLKIRNAKYYREQIPNALLFIVSDTAAGRVYWHPIQLDNDIDNRIIEAEAKGQKNISIYISPKKILNSETVEDFLKDVHTSYQIQSKRFISLTDFKIFQCIDDNIEIDKTKPILEQIHQYLSFKFKEINVIPIHLLIQHYPFKINNSFNPHYKAYSLSTDNEELFNFLESVKIKNDGELVFNKKEYIKGVENYKEKTKYVLTCLSRNLIPFIVNKSYKQINIQYNDNVKCECVRCKFLRFDFNDAFKELSSVPDKLQDKFRLAYVQYQIGNFLEAEKLFSKLVKECRKEHMNVKHFIAQYNLSKLSIFIRTQYWRGESQDVLAKKLEEIDLDKLQLELTSPLNEKLLNWIKTNSFFSKQKNKINETVSSIRDQYYHQLRGGWSSNSYVIELINEYEVLTTFLNSNYIIYDGFKEFNDLTDVFIEGLIASHAINKKQKSRLEYFNDWIISMIVFYGKTDSILKNVRRYNLKEFTYKKDSTNGDSFMNLLLRFLEGNPNTIKSFKKYCEPYNGYFWDRYNTIFNNLMVIAGICDLGKTNDNIIASSLFLFLKEEKSIQPYHIKYARFFITQKGRWINKETLKKLLLLSINNAKLHKEGFIEDVAEQIIRHHGKIKITTKNYEDLVKLAFDICPLCKQKHSAGFILHIYEVVAEEKIRIKIKERIVDTLKNKYDARFYYLSAILEVLDAKGEFFEKFVQNAKPTSKQTSFKSIFTGESDHRHSNLDMLINLCFKYDINLREDRFKDFKGIDAYYDWLLDMNGFNYDIFDPQWIREHPTNYYFKEIRKNKIIQKKLCEYLMSNRDPQLERYYVELFCWD